MISMSDDLMNFLDQDDGQGRNGYVCQVELGGGYLVYATGPRDARYFPVSGSTDKAEAEASAQECAKRMGVNSVGKVATLTMYGNTVKGTDRVFTWKGQENSWVHDISTFSGGYREVLRPSLAAVPDLEAGKRFWAHIMFKPDPNRPTRKDGRANLVPYVARPLGSEEEAEEYAASLSNQGPAMPMPDGFADYYAEAFPFEDADKAWFDMAGTIKEQLASGTPISNLMWEAAGITTDYLEKQLIALNGDEEVPF
jgi:hypothetical protein